MLILLICSLPLFLYARDSHIPVAMAYLGFASLGPPLVYTLSQQALYPDWRRRLLVFPVLALFGAGLALNNTRAAIEALRGRGGPFNRTPKFHLDDKRGHWAGSAYRLPLDRITLGEVMLAFYALVTIIAAIRARNLYAIPFLLLYFGGFGLTAALGIWQARHTRKRSKWLPANRIRPRPAQSSDRVVGTG